MKDLKKLFNPKTIAIIGASSEKKSVGWGLVKNALEGKKLRKIFCVNPYRKKVFGLKCFSKIRDIPEKVDLAIVAVPSKIVPQIVKECCQKGVGSIIVISSGFAERGKEGEVLQKKIVKTVKKANIPLLGPNCLGIIRPTISLNASFSPATPRAGKIAFISQSGALIDSVIDMSLLENFGFSYIISYGNEADLSLGDFLLWLKGDKNTKVIALYLEGIKDGRCFLKIAKEVSKIKPILALKAGKTKAGMKAAASHTAALAGSAEIYSAAFRKAKIIEVETIQELFDIAKTLAWQEKCKNGIGIVTNGGGCGVLITDYCQKLGIKLPKLDKETISKIKNSKVWHSAISPNNPLDILGDALAERYQVAIEAMLEQRNIRGLIIIQTIQIMTEVKKNVKIIIEERKKWPKKPIISVILKGKLSQEAIKLLEKNKIPNFPDLKRAALAMRALIR